MATILSAEEKLKRIQGQFPLFVGVIVKAVVERYGDEGRKLIMDALYHQGLIHGQKAFAEEFMVHEEDSMTDPNRHWIWSDASKHWCMDVHNDYSILIKEAK